MAYVITNYTKNQAKKLNVQVKPSTKKGKKIDVFKNGDKIASIGDIHYKDYPTYLLENKTLAIQRQKLYKLRHKKDFNSKNGFYADKLLWT